ncbi:MAG: hypothetical protein LBN30_11135 [Oscillospiraceae bacterium]|jgi:hypothetical protein|nr:hypothetical protein [Oscillospiraceae bacterium]
MKTSKRLISLLLALALMLSVCSMMAFAAEDEREVEVDEGIAGQGGVGAYITLAPDIGYGGVISWSISPFVWPLCSRWEIEIVEDGTTYYNLGLGNPSVTLPYTITSSGSATIYGYIV